MFPARCRCIFPYGNKKKNKKSSLDDMANMNGMHGPLLIRTYFCNSIENNAYIQDKFVLTFSFKIIFGATTEKYAKTRTFS